LTAFLLSYIASFLKKLVKDFLIVNLKVGLSVEREVDIDNEFAKCVKKIDGQVLDEILEQPNFKNADYWFPKYGTVAELKRLDENLAVKEDFKNKTTKLYSSWIERGLMPNLIGTIQFDLSQIPKVCAYEYIEIIKCRIENSIVKKANKQIRETKKYFGNNAKKGLLIIANDGNPTMKLDLMRYVLARILKNQHRSINSIIYFSANLEVNAPWLNLKESKNFFWLDCIINEREPAPQELRKELQSAWMSHLSTLFPDQLVAEFIAPNDRSLIERIEFN
jgi:hypothetical protein